MMYEYAREVLNYKLYAYKEKKSRLELSCLPEYGYIVREELKECENRISELEQAIKVLEEAGDK